MTVRTTIRAPAGASSLLGLPFGPFDPDGHRTFELALRAFVTQQTRFELTMSSSSTPSATAAGTRRAPMAGAARVISVGYLA